MEFEDAFQVLDNLVFAKTQARLRDVEKFILQGSWETQTYDAIADSSNYRYTPSYLKQDVGPKLWKRLSEILGQPVSKTNFRAALERLVRLQTPQSTSPAQPASTPAVQASLSTSRQDWGEAIDVSTFYGRTDVLTTLQHWILSDRCRLVALLGMGGIGKTSLSVKLAQSIGSQASVNVIWRSLRNAPPLNELLGDLIQFAAGDLEIELASSVGERISQLISYLQQSSVLMVLDNVESILSGSGPAGQYRAGYEIYGELFRLIGETAHQSCLVLTSREKPQEVADLEGDTLPIRSLQIAGLNETEAQDILQAKGLLGSVTEQKELIQQYGGNPLALKIVATSIQEIFDGNIAEFLAQGTTIFNGIRKLLDRQMSRLSDLEKEVMYWLAIEREPISFAELETDIVSPISKARLLEALESLVRRSLIDRSAGKFTQQPVVMEYMTESLIEHVCKELAEERYISTNSIPSTAHPTPYLRAYALIKAQAKDYIREIQIRLILVPIVNQLLQNFGIASNVEKRLNELLLWMQKNVPLDPGYAAGNTLNILRQLNLELSGYDLSNLTIRQAYLPNIPLNHVNFANANLAQSVFTETLSGISTIAFSPDGTWVATGDTDGEIHLWDVETGQQLLVCKGHARRVWAIAISPNGQTLANASEDQTVRLWDTKTGQCFQCLRGHAHWVVSVAFDPTGLYDGMNITNVTGLTDAQKASLQALGAVEGDRY